MKTAIITGITGQDGTYLSKFLIEKELQSNRYYSQPAKRKFEWVKFSWY